MVVELIAFLIFSGVSLTPVVPLSRVFFLRLDERFTLRLAFINIAETFLGSFALMYVL